MREMKDSGNRWIGSIPKWWDIDRFKHCVTMYTGNSIKDEQKNNYIDSVDAKPYISSKDINRVFSTIDYDNGLYIKNTDFSFRIAYKNDILMCIEGGSAGKKKAQLDRNVGFVNKLCCFHSKNKFIFPRFLFYYLSNPAYEDEFLYNITGMIGGVSVGKLGEFQIVLPPYEEQKAIASFLDKECAKIDEIMADVQSQIDALEDYKKSVISEAVTKGLNPDAELKDSGINYIGTIPAHWKTDKGKYIFTYVQKPVREDDGVITCFRDGEVTLRSNRREEGFTISEKEIGYQGIDTDEFDDQYAFASMRNNIGDLLVLPKSFNASYGDDPYSSKVEQYFEQNILAQTLNARKYINNPNFLRFVSRSHLPFKAYSEFKKAAIGERAELYKKILMWNWDINGGLEE